MQKFSFSSILMTLFCTLLNLQTDLKAQTIPQTTRCGISEQDALTIYNNMIELRERHPIVAPMRAIAYVPVWFHLVAQDDGTGRVSTLKILEMLCEWNRIYAATGAGFQFYIKGINNIDNAQLYDTPQSLGALIAINNNKKSDGMNVYMVNKATINSQPGVTTLGYYINGPNRQYESDYIVIINSEVSAGGATTIAHEAGHFFSLPHTFFGWESCPFQPTAAVPCASPTVNCNGGGTYLVENAARTGTDANCATAADGFCDTPPDYNLGLGYNSCTYVGQTCDPKGVKIDPDERNIMSYFTGCETTFSPMQIAAMQNNYLNHEKRSYLRSGNIAPSATTLATVNPISPQNGGTTPYYNNFTLTWEAVPNATSYIVEISKSPTFSLSRTFFVNTNSININNNTVPGYLTTPEQSYFWRVKPYNNYLACTANSSRQSFVAGILNSAKDISGVSGFDISPNPLSKNQPLQLNLTTETAFDAQIKLFNVAGQLIQTEKRHFDAGFSSQNISVSNLNNGLYFLSIESEKGVLNKKIVISR